MSNGLLSSSLFLLLVLVVYTNAQQNQFQGWTPQQIEQYRQHYYNWYHGQAQQQQQQQQQPAVQPVQQHVATQAPVNLNNLHHHPMFRHFEKDDKGNVWHGNDDAKILIISRSSYP